MTVATFTCLIPAHNEAARIGQVLAAVRGHSALAEVIVIDDGSTDGTADLAERAGVRVLRLSPNRGKTAALAEGLALVRTSHVLLLDADLSGLCAADITRLIAPVAEGRAKVTLSLRGNAPLVWRMLGVDYITGERVLPMSLIQTRLHHLISLPRFGLEVFLNERIREAGLTVAVVSWPKVASPTKAHKRGLWAGLRQDLGMMADIFRTIGFIAPFRQMAFLWSFGHRPVRFAAVRAALGRS